MFPIAATCFRNLSDLLCEEIRRLGFAQARILNREVVVVADELSEEEIRRLSRELRIARRVIRLFGASTDLDLPGIVAQFEDLPFEKIISERKTFGVAPERLGSHKYTSEDLGRDLGSCVRRRFRGIGREVPPVNLRNPDQTIVATTHDGDFYFGLDLVGPLDRRGASVIQHRAPLNRTIAAAMLRLSSFRDHQSVLDPLAGSGTIVLEAAAMADRIAESTIIAGEKSFETYESLKQNISDAGVIDRVSAFHGDARRLDYIEAGDYPLIVTNPPYGVRMGSSESIEQLYANFAKAAFSKGVREVVGITTRKNNWLDGMEKAGYSLKEARPILYERLSAWIFVHELGSVTNCKSLIPGGDKQ